MRIKRPNENANMVVDIDADRRLSIHPGCVWGTEGGGGGGVIVSNPSSAILGHLSLSRPSYNVLRLFTLILSLGFIFNSYSEFLP